MAEKKFRQVLEVLHSERTQILICILFLISFFSHQIGLSNSKIESNTSQIWHTRCSAVYNSSAMAFESQAAQQSWGGTDFKNDRWSGLLFSFLLAAFLRTNKTSLSEPPKPWSLEDKIPFIGILESTNTLLAVNNARGKSIYHNPAFTSAYGYSVAEINAIGGFFALFEDSEMAKLYYELHSDNKSWKCEAEFRAKNGRIISTLLFADPILNPSDECLGYVFSCTDVTKRKQVEKTLQTRNRAIEASSNGIVISDVRLLDTPIIYINKAFEKITGYPITDIVGRPFLFLLDNEENKETKTQLLNAMNAGENCDINISLLRKDGSKVWVELNISPVFNSAGEITHYVGIQSDITNQKKVEQELKQYARDLERTKKSLEDKANELASTIGQLKSAKLKAEDATKAKSEFLANISHEIRTPLNGIIGMTDLVLDTELVPEQKEYLDTIKVSSESLLTIINDILDFSKIEAGKLELYDDKFSLRESIGETIKTLAIRAHQKGLELSYYVSADVPDLLIGDPGRLRQILVNLIGNSIKFTDTGHIIIRVARNRIGNDKIGLHFSVEDSGIGIPKDKQKLIFNAFDQVDRSDSRLHGGTGLGLAISSKLINLMDGEFWVESPVASRDKHMDSPGSIFHFIANFGLVGDVEAATSFYQTKQLKDLPVLIVDDNKVNRDFLAEMLRSWEMCPETAKSAKQALAVLSEQAKKGKQTELILFDADLPDIDGSAFMRRVKSDSSLKDVVSVLMVSHAKPGEKNDLNHSIRLTKPVKPSELFSTILRALEFEDDKVGKTYHANLEQEAIFSKEFKILLAEDNKVNQKLTSRMLEKNGHKVVIAQNGIEAIEKMQEDIFDLILMDVQMPEMDGFSATQKIRELEKNSDKRIPIIALTAYAMKGDREKCLAAGMDNYLSKPINFRALRDTINHIMSKQGK